ncbi:unnamed protein product [Euphydryas editha]|uniref:THAP-type domain-containing protein n=1 Tax=Euphydryas editha TaxID=104508 RepID=A0AAU9U6H5_EUPED|nr:unnamed protein product [Euphydryas editha]
MGNDLSVALGVSNIGDHATWSGRDGSLKANHQVVAADARRETCYHRCSFPRNDELRQRWLEVVPFKTKSNHSFICSQHFKSEDKIFHGVKSTLKPNAIPNIFTFEPDEYLIEKSSAQNDNDSNASNLDEESNSIAYVSKKRRRSDSSSDSSVVQSVQSNEIPNDEFQIFGNYVASELRSMHYEKNIKELKRVIQQHIVRWTEEDDREYFLS